MQCYLHRWLMLMTFLSTYAPKGCYGACTDGRKTCEWYPWESWSECSLSCGGGTRYRPRPLCCNADFNATACLKECGLRVSDARQIESCNTFCYNGGVYDGSSCLCPDKYYSSCCSEARTTSTTTTTATPSTTTIPMIITTTTSTSLTQQRGASIVIILGVLIPLIVLTATCIIGLVIYRKKKKSKVTDARNQRIKQIKSGVSKNLVVNDDGLPHHIYASGDKQGVLEQTHPLDTRLQIPSAIKPTLTPQQRPLRVVPGLRRFGQGPRAAYSGAAALLIVSGRKKPQVSQDSNSDRLDQNGSTNIGTVYPDSLINDHPRGAVPDNEVPQPMDESSQEKVHREKRKKNKKNIQSELDDGDPNKTE